MVRSTTQRLPRKREGGGNTCSHCWRIWLIVRPCRDGGLGWTDHFDGPAEVLAQPTDECAAVVAIAPHMAQAGKETVQGSQHLLGTFQVGAIGCQDFHSQ